MKTWLRMSRLFTLVVFFFNVLFRSVVNSSVSECVCVRVCVSFHLLISTWNMRIMRERETERDRPVEKARNSWYQVEPFI